MGTIDFTKITACGECCFGCKKKDEGLCEGCIESDGRCKEWAQSGECLDVVISMAAVMYIKDIESVFSNVGKSLKENGIFVFSFNDPTFYSVAAKYLWNDPAIPVGDWEIGRYKNLLGELGCNPAE